MSKKLEEHPFIAVIDAFLAEHGVPPNQVKAKEGTSIYWSFVSNPGLYVWFSLYADEFNEIFVHLDVSFGRIKSNDRAVFLLLLQKNFEHHYPLWFAVDEAGLVCLKFRCYADGINRAHLLIRLQTIMQLGRRSLIEFVTNKSLLDSLHEEAEILSVRQSV